LASAVIEIGALRGLAPTHSAFYLWTAPAWLAWYLYAIRGKTAEQGGTLDARPFQQERKVAL
jgi:hypothetical protein